MTGHDPERRGEGVPRRRLHRPVAAQPLDGPAPLVIVQVVEGVELDQAGVGGQGPAPLA